MQTRIAAMKNIKYGLSLNNTNALVPRAADAVEVVSLAFGGVCGKIKLINPKAAEARAAI